MTDYTKSIHYMAETYCGMVLKRLWHWVGLYQAALHLQVANVLEYLVFHLFSISA